MYKEFGRFGLILLGDFVYEALLILCEIEKRAKLLHCFVDFFLSL